MTRRQLFYLALYGGWLIVHSAFGQRLQPARSGSVLDIGIRLQKSVNLYTENGLTLQYTHPKLVHSRLYLGASYVTSRLGTALFSNAIKQDNLLLSTSYHFRPTRTVQPFVKMNAGYFKAHYEEDIFKDLPQSSPLVSPEAGLCYSPAFPLKIGASLGYNLITGNGVTGPGTLYPVFVQMSIFWNLLNQSTTRP
ncbi:hypothetical protein GCM10027347_54470 [Larkinella harenae]